MLLHLHFRGPGGWKRQSLSNRQPPGQLSSASTPRFGRQQTECRLKRLYFHRPEKEPAHWQEPCDLLWMRGTSDSVIEQSGLGRFMDPLHPPQHQNTAEGAGGKRGHTVLDQVSGSWSIKSFPGCVGLLLRASGPSCGQEATGIHGQYVASNQAEAST